MKPLSPELYWLLLTVILTGVLWIPYILRFLSETGFVPALMDGEHATRPKAAWAQRAMRAHNNAVENLAVFAPLAIMVHLMETGTSVTTTACAVFFWARLAHALVYIAGLPLVRTLAFAVGFVCQAVLAMHLLGWI